MELYKKVLNSKTVQRLKRTLALKSRIYCKVKLLSPTVSPEMRYALLLNHFGITKVLDVGANTGQFAESLIDFGFKGKIVSFEPVEKAYAALAKRASRYPNWTLAERGAIGNIDGEIEINVSEETQFSSIKQIKQDFTETVNEARVGKKELVKISRLDSLINKYYDKNDVIFLKIDTQGFEKEVIEGAQSLINMCKGMSLEIPLINELEIYEGVEWDLNFYINYMAEKGFKCVSIDALGANSKSGFVNEADGVFFRYS